ncbi:hypothetical protein K505DRAFT_368061 [Melanomma pulvis-pyrius CBS 109.77]|uniref:Zn(2)-C6 fungal-type domain-containing protein n=1 Tax=Melanomma pulvis-pyrius CBS 109.77 TaxID=1314802 RepID=A0A6A6WS68_9PLEO|nr:hypothetical protein K505DRAFT_368061 [Melanomma pulvis-pyrius CBS 109.77]
MQQQERRPDGTRTRTGCITCRVRKKKCDEQRPSCQACRSRQLACYGFNAPPPVWYTSKTSWEEVRNSDEAKSLRTVAETRYKISRRVVPKTDSAKTSTLSAEDFADCHQPCRSFHLRARFLPHDLRTSPSSPLLKAGVNIWQLQPESIWWDSKIKSLVPDPGSSSHEETRLLMLFLDVIHPITHTFYKLSSSRDRGWMLDRLVSKPSLYSSALSISACFDHSLTQPPSINDIGICSKVRTLQSKAICDLRMEIDKFAAMESTPVEDFVWAGAQILDVIIHLQTLEIFSMLQGHWEMHHRAARKILNHIEICAPAGRRGSKREASVIGATLSSLLPDDPRRRSLEFSICNFTWMDILATSTFGAQSFDSCAFDYLELLQSEAIKPQNIMGCQGWIMAVIAKIVRLEQWKIVQEGQMHGADINAELARQSDQISDELNDGIDKLERGHQHVDAAGAEEDIRQVSIIWAYGAHVLRQFVLSDAQSDESAMDQTLVNACLQKLEAVPTRLVMRTTWPFTIAGSMASSEHQQARFRWVLGKTMQEAQPPGISWKGLIIMEECWRLRRIHGQIKIGWKEAMESLGARAILT